MSAILSCAGAAISITIGDSNWANINVSAVLPPLYYILVCFLRGVSCLRFLASGSSK